MLAFDQALALFGNTCDMSPAHSSGTGKPQNSIADSRYESYLVKNFASNLYHKARTGFNGPKRSDF